MKNGRNVIILILAAMVLFCQESFADSKATEEPVAVAMESAPNSYTKDEIDAMLGQIRRTIPKIPKRYTNAEINNIIAKVRKTIPNVSGNYTNKQIDGKIATVKKSIPRIPDVYSKEEIKIRIMALNDAITNLEIALLNIRNSIPAELKWPVKTKKILTGIRDGIPADIVGNK